jgi:hypothetical protein
MRNISRIGSRQRGMGMLGVIFTVSLVAFFMTLLFKLGPLYLNFWTIRSIMTGVVEQSESIQGGARGVIDTINKRMDVNSVKNITAKDFAVQKIEQNTYQVTVEYEQRVHLFFNIDAVAMFNYQVDVKTQ